jgi:hypothetical protein
MDANAVGNELAAKFAAVAHPAEGRKYFGLELRY